MGDSLQPLLGVHSTKLVQTNVLIDQIPSPTPNLNQPFIKLDFKSELILQNYY